MAGFVNKGAGNVISSVTVSGEQLKKIAEILKINNPNVRSAKIEFMGDGGTSKSKGKSQSKGKGQASKQK